MLIILLLSCLVAIVIIGLTYLMLEYYFKFTQNELYVPFVPADRKGIENVLTHAEIDGSENVIDIGSGWGSILFLLLDKYPSLSVTGIEINPFLSVVAWVRKILWYRTSKMSIINKDARDLTYEAYDIVFVFMLSSFLDKVLAPKLAAELRPGAKVISYVFAMHSDAFSVEEFTLPASGQGWRSKVYIYTKK
jgi:cyclopropane fatty-acyl-phospholipid synthase-like methyltransferase